ncbi:MFS transporter [Testudinibacter sp. P27/CKL/0425]
MQPLAGIAAEYFGARRVLFFGIVLLAVGSAATPLLQSNWGIILTLGLLSAMGSGIGSFSLLMGEVANKLPPQARGMASGVINAGGSFGQFVFAPILQRLILGFGWMSAMYALALMCLTALPFAWKLTQKSTAAKPHLQSLPANSVQNQTQSAVQTTENPAIPTLKQTVKQAVRDRSYILLSLGFFTCGFHIAFLVTHLPVEVSLQGLPTFVAAWTLSIIGVANIVGSLAVGAMVNHYRSKYLLFGMYAIRALLITVYLLSPHSTTTFYLFAVGLGLTWLATVPPTAAIIGKLFGVRYLATLFGICLFVHQIGGFFGAYLGGLAMQQHGNYQWMWYADIVLAALAAFINLPIREKAVK